VSAAEQHVVLGRVSGLFGVRGWVKVFSHTAPRDAIVADYRDWTLSRDGKSWQVRVAEGREQGKLIIARIDGIDDRNQAEALLSAEISVPREAMPASGEDGYYWADLVGLKVINKEGVEFGVIDHLFETGANDVIVVRGERQRLIPWVSADTAAAMEDAEFIPTDVDPTIVSVDLEQRVLTVDWDAEF
jgi:16S rRNA processing protein RimM